MVGFTWLSKLLIEILTPYFLGEVRSGNYLISCKSLTIFLAAVCLLLFSEKVRISPFFEKIIRVVSPMAFDVYLVQNHPLLFTYILKERFTVCAVIRWFSLPVLSTISLVLAPILFWKSCDVLTLINEFDCEPMWFCKQSFFIYTAHDFIVESLSAILSKVSDNIAWVSICFIVTPIIVLALLYVVARLLFQRLPKVYQLLCGGRNK